LLNKVLKTDFNKTIYTYSCNCINVYQISYFIYIYYLVIGMKPNQSWQVIYKHRIFISNFTEYLHANHLKIFFIYKYFNCIDWVPMTAKYHQTILEDMLNDKIVL